MSKVIKGIVNTKDVDGTPRYKVRYEGLAKEGDDWVGADQVTEKQIEKFQAMKAKAAAKAGGAVEPAKAMPAKASGVVKTIDKDAERERKAKKAGT